jgi:radical SAM superfamily enzyme YgiQ (UPF0313 family)
MQVCLVNAATAAEFSDTAEFEAEEIRRGSSDPQLGILSLAAVLEAQGCCPQIVDLNRMFYRYADAVGESGLEGFAELAASQIGAIDADVYGFGSICSAYPLALRIAKEVKRLRPEAAIVFGGPQASVVSDQTLKSFPCVDFVLRGEAEESLPILLEELFGGRRFDLVPGLTHRSVWGVQRNVDAPLLVDLDALPSPAYHLTGELRGLARASLELGRGCPFSCTFCSTNDFFRRKFRLRSPERILKDMRAIEAEYGIRDFDLVHDMFTVDRKRVQAFCHALIDSGQSYTWSCSARTDCVDEELIELMAAAGCNGMFFGVETGSERMQKIIDKHLDTRRAHEIIDIVERAGIRSTISLIIGFPQETRDDLRDTIAMFMHSARVPLSGPQINILAPLANTPLHVKYKDRMTLDLLCSDMSHQGRKQHSEDMELIRNYPDIFPNFYLLPTPELDRSMLLELREFTLMAEMRFRWLLGAADQAGAGILDLFTDWVELRDTLYPRLAGSDLRHYYRTPRFLRDFIAFLRSHAVGTNEALKLFLEYEDAVSCAQSPQSPQSPRSSRPLRRNDKETLDWSDIPVRKNQSRVIELSRGLDEAIDAVMNCQEPEWETGRQHYVVGQEPGKKNPAYHVSSRIAKTVEACNGRRTVCHVVKHLATEFPSVPESRRDYEFVRLIETAWAEDLIEIFRSDSAAADNQDAGFSMPEYTEMSAAASARNQASIQAL